MYGPNTDTPTSNTTDAFTTTLEVSNEDPDENTNSITVKLPNVFVSVLEQPARINSLNESNIPTETREFTKKVLKLSDGAYSRLVKAEFPLLTASFFPDANGFRFRIGCDWMEWVFFFDDLLDEGRLHNKPAEARAEIKAHLDIHEADHPDISPNDHPIRYMYQCFWKKLRFISTPGAQARYIHSMRHYFEGCLAQVDTHYWSALGHPPPTLDMLLRHRLHSVGARPVQALLEPLHQISLPDEIWQNPLIRELQDIAIQMVFLHNDMFSYRREECMFEAVPHNAVHAILQEQELGVQEAFKATGKILDVTLNKWFWAEKEILGISQDANMQAQIRRYLENLLDIVRGNIHWSFKTGRYFGKESDEVRKTMQFKLPIQK